MSSGVQVVLTSLSATNANPVLAAKLAKLKTQNEKIAALSGVQQNTPLRAKRDQREAIMAEVSESGLLVAGSLVGYARTHGLTELASEMALTRSDFKRLRRPQRIRLAQRILAAAREVLAELAVFGVTPAMLDEFETLVGRAAVAIDDLRDSAGMRKTATGQLAREIEILLAQLENEIDPLMAPVRKTDHALWMRYANARQIMERPGRRSREAEATATPAATPVAAGVASTAPAPSVEKQAA